MDNKIGFVIADDHAMFREGLVGLLTEESDIEVVGPACDVIGAVEMTQLLSPDFKILNVSMPEVRYGIMLDADCEATWITSGF